jgi:peptidoglycan/xylan/chitin deacetylase (PgdA/CDA1 family)
MQLKLVLNFHGIGPKRKILEPGEERVWISQDEAKDILDIAKTDNSISITVDDGNQSDVEVLLPLLVERGLTATFFPIVSRLNTPFYLTTKDCKRLVECGMKIGSHGMNHISLHNLSQNDYQKEISCSFAFFSTHGIVAEKIVACPFGRYNRRTISILQNNGLQNVLTSDGGWAYATDFVVARNSVGTNFTIDDLKSLLHNKKVKLFQLVKRTAKRWL